MSKGWRAYSGVIHVHTDDSGGAPFEAILKAAKATDTDFVVLTDRVADREKAASLEGWHDGVLILSGEEVCCPDGHFLAFEIRDPIGECESVERGIEEVRRQVGVVVGVHYHYAMPGRPVSVPPPVPAADVDLVEIWSFLDEFLISVPGSRALQHTARPEQVLRGPSRTAVRQWDREMASRPIAAVGSLNAHLRKEPLLEWKELFPYETTFRTIRTVVLCPELPKVDVRARDMVWTAIRRGSSFVCNQSLADAREFEFTYQNEEGRSFQVGESLEYRPGGRICVEMPREAEVVIRLNSHPLFWGTGKSFSFPAPAPGVYRIEAYLDRRAWIYSNAIRLLGDDRSQTVSTTVVDFT